MCIHMYTCARMYAAEYLPAHMYVYACVLMCCHACARMYAYVCLCILIPQSELASVGVLAGFDTVWVRCVRRSRLLEPILIYSYVFLHIPIYILIQS